MPDIEEIDEKKEIAYKFLEIKDNFEMLSSDIADKLNTLHPDLDYTDFEIRGYKAWLTREDENHTPKKRKSSDISDRKRIAIDYINANPNLTSSQICDDLNSLHPDMDYKDFEIRGYKAWLTMGKED